MGAKRMQQKLDKEKKRMFNEINDKKQNFINELKTVNKTELFLPKRKIRKFDIKWLLLLSVLVIIVLITILIFK